MALRLPATVDALREAILRSARFREWLRGRRWCGEAVGSRTPISIKDHAVLLERPTEALVFFLIQAEDRGTAVSIHLPLAVTTAKLHEDAFELRVGSVTLWVTEAEHRESYAEFLLDGFRENATHPTASGDALRFRGSPLGAFRSMLPTAVGDSSNLLLQVETTQRQVVFKSYKLVDTRNREPGILGRLDRKKFPHVPRYFGEFSLGRGEDRTVLAVATERVDAVDLFTWLTGGWQMELGGKGAVVVPVFESASLDLASALGAAMADLHDALADRRPGPFQVETFESRDAAAAVRSATENLEDALRRLGALARGGDEAASDFSGTARRWILDARRNIDERLRGLEGSVGGPKSVTHADLHLAQVLRGTQGGVLQFIDFEGEPGRAPGQRSGKLPPLRDVATMNRSFAYVKHYAWREVLGDPVAGLRFMERDRLSGDTRSMAERLVEWEAAAVDRLSRGYLERSHLHRSLAPTEGRRAIRGWMMEKALYELRYELTHRPENVIIPLEGVLSLAFSRSDPREEV